MVTASDDGTARLWIDETGLWSADLATLHAYAKTLATRMLRPAERERFFLAESRPAVVTEVADDPVSRCDRMAGDPLDLDREVPGIAFDFVDGARAAEACAEAIAASPDTPRLRYQLARALDKTKDHANAFAEYQSAADAGYRFAVRALGRAYLDGRGVARSVSAALEQLETASAAGVSLASRELAQLYWAGDGLPRDLAKAREFMDKAASQGDAASHQRLASMYEAGEGVEANVGKALFHHTVAARLFAEQGTVGSARHESERRATLARLLTIKEVAGTWREAHAWQATQ